MGFISPLQGSGNWGPLTQDVVLGCLMTPLLGLGANEWDICGACVRQGESGGTPLPLYGCLTLLCSVFVAGFRFQSILAHE